MLGREGGLRRLVSAVFLLAPVAQSCSDSEPTAVLNTPPTAEFTVRPDSTCYAAVTVDASASSDAEDLVGALRFRWDWEGDGVWDTGWMSNPTETAPGGPVGPTIRLQVLDQGGATSEAQRSLHKESGVQIRSAYRYLGAVFTRSCCNGPPNCHSCEINERTATSALGHWSVSLYGRSQVSYVGADSIWAQGSGGEGNYVRVEFDLCDETLLDIVEPGRPLRLTDLGTGEVVELEERAHRLVLSPGPYRLFAQVTSRSFRATFRAPSRNLKR